MVFVMYFFFVCVSKCLCVPVYGFAPQFGNHWTKVFNGGERLLLNRVVSLYLINEANSIKPDLQGLQAVANHSFSIFLCLLQTI